MFKQGELVKQDEPLYHIEPDSFQAAEQQARGALFQAQAKYANATAQRARTEELVTTHAAPRAQLDQQVALEKSAQGEVVVADANLRAASINLGYTSITTPVVSLLYALMSNEASTASRLEFLTDLYISVPLSALIE